MTHDAAFKRRVRARMAETGEKFTTARRALLDDPKQAVEAHYLFTPPRTIEYVTSSTRTELQPPEPAGPAFSWGYAGSGPNTASWAVLEHATGDCDLRLAIAFTEDNLDWWDELSDRMFALTVAEVRAWRREREPFVRAIPRGQSWTPQQLAGEFLNDLESGETVAPWWQAYREVHGQPKINLES